MESRSCHRNGNTTRSSALAIPVSVKSCDLNTRGGCSVSISTSLRSSFCHLTSTLRAMMLTASGRHAEATTPGKQSRRHRKRVQCKFAELSQPNFILSRRPWKRQSHAAQQNSSRRRTRVRFM